ncbi:MAG: HAD family hydrolase, partial [Methylococcales bacterium]
NLLRTFSGKSYDLIQKILADEFGCDFPMPRFRELSAEFWHQSVEITGLAVKPGLPALLACFEQYSIPFCLATNSERRYAEKCLAYAGLANAFPKRITRDQVKAAKPAPDIFLAAAANLGFQPEQCIVLEDSETGALAALAANTRLILVAQPDAVSEAVRDRAFAELESLEAFREWIEIR